MQTKTLLAVVLALMAVTMTCVQPAYAGQAYRYTTVNGVLSFVDDIEHVPLRYQAEAVLVELAKLGTYERLTIAAPARSSFRVERLRREQAAAADWSRRLRVLKAQREWALVLPFHATREMRWVEGHLGYSGKRYVAVDVLRDANGRTVAAGLSEIGLVPGALMAGSLQ